MAIVSYSNKELFYKIHEIDKDKLTLISLKDGRSTSFIRIGAKIDIEPSTDTKTNCNEEINV